MLTKQTDHRHQASHRSILTLFLIAIGSLILFVCALSAHSQAFRGEELQKQIYNYEAISAHADPPTMAPVPASRVWEHLGALYEDAGMYPQSETAYAHAIRLLKTAPGADADLARAIDGLGALYMMWGDLSQAERAEQQALSIRQAKGLTADLVASWYHLTGLALREHRFDKARDYAQRAVDQLQTEPSPDPDEGINARFALGAALYRLQRYAEAIAIMQSAMEIVHRNYRPGDFPAAFGSFLLGLVYWKSGDAERARDLMKDGADVAQKQLGWSHPVCLAIMNEYELYLRSTHQKDEARAVREELRQHRGADVQRRGQGTLNIAALF
ncbi:MAG: tetratricopeptide repeat protein [Terracidiphilus sp.]